MAGDGSAEQREKELARREAEVARREWLADERDRIADERDRIANHREQMADQREASADEREGSAAERERERLDRAADAVARTEADARREEANIRREMDTSERRRADDQPSVTSRGVTQASPKRLPHNATHLEDHGARIVVLTDDPRRNVVVLPGCHLDSLQQQKNAYFFEDGNELVGMIVEGGTVEYRSADRTYVVRLTNGCSPSGDAQ